MQLSTNGSQQQQRQQCLHRMALSAPIFFSVYGYDCGLSGHQWVLKPTHGDPPDTDTVAEARRPSVVLSHFCALIVFLCVHSQYFI
jgi:hypothetical protein